MTHADVRAAFSQHKDVVYRFAWRMTRSPADAEDIAQEVFLSLLKRPDSFCSDRGSLRAFLLGTARNISLKRRRQEDRMDGLSDDQFVAQPIDPEGRETEEIVAAAVQQLPPLQREVLILAEYEELSLEEIAHAVGAEVGTVKSRLHRARENLRRMLAPLKPANVRSVWNR
jgi:RNA polymerase sigma-70 factor (ECF subfamily)